MWRWPWRSWVDIVEHFARDEWDAFERFLDWAATWTATTGDALTGLSQDYGFGELIARIEQRPQMYLGEPSLRRLADFVSGYLFAVEAMGVADASGDIAAFRVMCASIEAGADGRPWWKVLRIDVSSDEESWRELFVRWRQIENRARLTPTIETALHAVLVRRGFTVRELSLVPHLSNDQSLVMARAEINADGTESPLELADRLTPHQLLSHQQHVIDLVDRLRDGRQTCVLFLNAVSIEAGAGDGRWDAFSIPEQFVSLQCNFDDGRMNGLLSIVGAVGREIRMYAAAIGHSDRFRGVLTSRTFKDVVACLGLHDPLPSTEPRGALGANTYDALLSVIANGDVFFEEIGNGTVLRVIGESNVLDALDA